MYANLPLADHPDLANSLAHRQLSNFATDLITNFARDGYVVIDLDLPDFDSLAAKIIRDLGPAH